MLELTLFRKMVAFVYSHLLDVTDAVNSGKSLVVTFPDFGSVFAPTKMTLIDRSNGEQLGQDEL